MTTYRERREARADRLREWADKREAKAETAHAAAKAISDMIPFGQPMMPGHHSYKGDVSTRNRMRSNYERSFDHAKKADEMRSKAANIEAAADHAIYSDDPDATERLAERIAHLEAERARLKAYNASCRKGTPNLELLTEHDQKSLEMCLKYSPVNAKAPGSFPAYVLSNLSGNISRLRKRLETL